MVGAAHTVFSKRHSASSDATNADVALSQQSNDLIAALGMTFSDAITAAITDVATASIPRRLTRSHSWHLWPTRAPTSIFFAQML